jgi:hypothetical protein
LTAKFNLNGKTKDKIFYFTVESFSISDAEYVKKVLSLINKDNLFKSFVLGDNMESITDNFELLNSIDLLDENNKINVSFESGLYIVFLALIPYVFRV